MNKQMEVPKNEALVISHDANMDNEMTKNSYLDAMIQKGKNYRELLYAGTAYLEQCGVPDASFDAWCLMAEAMEMTRSHYLMDQMRPCEDEAQVVKFREMLALRGQRIPLQHILGRAPFMGYDFYVNEHVLTPRADTEILVEETLRCMEKMCATQSVASVDHEKMNVAQDQLKGESDLKVLDMCTGSGCIAISLYLMGKASGKSVSVMAADLSEEALQVASKNNHDLAGDCVTIVYTDMFKQLPEDTVFDIIVSNPPYIPSKEIPGLMPEVAEHEPHMALDGLEDGLHYYRILAKEGRKWLKSGGYLTLEIGCDQGESVPALLLEQGFEEVQVVKDLAGLDRVVIGHL